MQMDEDYQLALRKYGDEAGAVLKSIGGDANGGETGYLTARIASHLFGQANVQAWEDVQNLAAAEGRHAILEDLPEGFTPIERPLPGDRSYTSVQLNDVTAGATTASAYLVAGSPRTGGQVFSYEFVKVEGQWFISYMESSWSQGDPDYLD